jgi:tetratricopeptide (TPR) repeat protein
MNPSYAQAHHWFALALASVGKSVDALSEIETAEKLDPKSLAIKSAGGIVKYFSGDYAGAIEYCDRALAIDNKFVPAYKVKRWVYQTMGNIEAARESLERERLYSGGNADDPGWQIVDAQLASEDAESRASALAILEKAIQEPEIRTNDFAYAYEIALAYDRLGEKNRVLDYLERAERAGTHSMNLAEVDPRLAKYRKEPRFMALIAKFHKNGS